MKKIKKLFWGYCFWPIGLVVLAVGVALTQVQKTTPVLVSFPERHGTGVYLGNNLILTAAHVTRDREYTRIVTHTKEELIGKVLWSENNIDIAMVMINASVLWDGAKIDCISPNIGDKINAVGYGYSVGPLQSWGYVSTDKRDLTDPGDPLWPEVIFADLRVAPGMSGGPVFDENNKIRAIVVGVTPHGFSILVPSAVLCRVIEEQRNKER